MFTLSCPACGGQIIFRSKASVFASCPYCKSTVVRQDMDLEVYGSVADIQLDQSPLQIGTRGRLDGKMFELVGRMRLEWEDGFWNEWYALFDDGREGWLSEAQGFYAMSFQHLDISDLPVLKDLVVGNAYQLKVQHPHYVLEGIKETICQGSEGELPVRAPRGRETKSIDLSAPGGLFACIEYPLDEEPRLFFGRYYDFSQYDFSFLREIDGW